MRLLHAADLHLDSPLQAQAARNPELAGALRAASRRVLARIVDLAIAHEVAALALAGDVFDNGVADLTSRAALTVELGRLARHGIPTVMIRGNHDALLDLGRYGPIAEGVHILDAATPTVTLGGAAFHGLSHGAARETESLLPRYPAPIPGRINVGLMHTSLGGAEGHDPYAPCAEADLLGFGYDYWALGHIHARFERRAGRALAVMPGIPQGRSIRERGRGSVTLAAIGPDGATAEALPVAEFAFDAVPVDLSRAETQQDLVDACLAAMRRAARDGCDSVLRLQLTDAPPRLADPALAAELLEQSADRPDGVWIEAIRLAPAAVRPPAGALAELDALMAEILQSPGFRDEAAASLAEWRAALPREIADTLDPAEAEALAELGRVLVMGRLAAGADRA